MLSNSENFRVWQHFITEFGKNFPLSQRGLGIIFHYKPDSVDYFPQCLSQKFTILTTEFVPGEVLQYAKTTF
jgi:hypothetical protein